MRAGARSRRGAETTPRRTLVAAFASCALALLLLAPAAGADISFGPVGTGAGELSSPSGLAVDLLILAVGSWRS